MELLFIVLLVITSIVGVTFIVERGLALRWKKIVPPEVQESVDHYRGEANLAHLRQACHDFPSPLSRLLLIAEEHRAWPKGENIDAIQTRARYEVTQMERGLVILEIVVGIAPLLGLVGTIYGLIILFRSMGADFNDNSAIAGGIALALRATLLGLLTAIPALIAWSYFNKKVETLAVEMETICDQFLRRLYAQEQTRPPQTNSPIIKH